MNYLQNNTSNYYGQQQMSILLVEILLFIQANGF